VQPPHHRGVSRPALMLVIKENYAGRIQLVRGFLVSGIGEA
jgi:hypothetical protein